MAEVAVPPQMFADRPGADRPVAGTARAGMTGAEVRCGEAAMVEARLNAGKAPRFAAQVLPPDDSDSLSLATKLSIPVAGSLRKTRDPGVDTAGNLADLGLPQSEPASGQPSVIVKGDWYKSFKGAILAANLPGIWRTIAAIWGNPG